ncbi:MAG: hypothetical protein IH830_01365, partial [Planctomycetes bacterium]|nr:hypothetical protein [Planctomycetota bacterium]
MPTHNTHHEVLFHRYDGNPILTAAHWPYPANSVFNPGAIRLADGTTLLLCRVEDRRGHSHFCAARSADGVNNWQIDPQPTMAPDPRLHPEELWGIEDPRITYAAELGKYVVVYTAFSWGGPGVALAMTEDFRHFERCGVVMSPEDKDAALLPRQINGRWVMIHRPSTPMGAHVWVSYSPDLRHWGDHKLVLRARRGGWWDANKIGLSPPLIETDQGWTASTANNPSSGFWQRGVPVNDPGWDYDPASDSDGSGQCYLTQNQAGNTDVDAGNVLLTSPSMDMSGGNITISYDYYLRLTNTDGGVDRMLVEINNLREVARRCIAGEPMDDELSRWIGTSLQNFLDRRCDTIEDALGLRAPQGGVPWWMEIAIRTRDAAQKAASMADTRSSACTKLRSTGSPSGSSM